MKPIKSRINRIKWLRDGCKALLVEVCELHEAGKGGCWATNKHLAERLGCDEITVSRRISQLYNSGIISRDVIAAQANRRILAPSAALQAAYRSEEDALIDELTIVNNVDTPKPTIVNNVVDYSQKCTLTIVKNVLDYSRFRGDLSKRKEEQEKIRETLLNLNSQHDTDVAAIAALSLENEQLAERLRKASKEFRALRDENDLLKKQLEAKQTRVVRAAKKHLFADSPYSNSQAVADGLAGTDYEHADAAYYHEAIRNWAESKGELKADWLATIRSAMLRDSREGKLKLNHNSQLIPTQHDKQQQSARNTKLGLVDTVALAESLAFCKSLGI